MAERFAPGTVVEVMDCGRWVGACKVLDQAGRTPDHLVLINLQNQCIFELYNDAPYNVRVKEA